MNIHDAMFVVIDCETTGLDPETDKLVEIAAVATTRERVVGMWATLINPGIPIPPETSGIHGITNEMVSGAPSSAQAIFDLNNFIEYYDYEAAPFPVAHNAQFDKGFISPAHAMPWLCTKRLAQHLWPGAPNHRNQTLRYWRNLRFDDYGIQAHRALGDAIVTAALLRDILANLPDGITTVADMQEYCDAPILYKTWWFGKSYGEPILGTDPGYIAWALKNVQMDADQRFSLESALQQT